MKWRPGHAVAWLRARAATSAKQVPETAAGMELGPTAREVETPAKGATRADGAGSLDAQEKSQQIIKMSDAGITMEQLELRMKQIMIEVDERAANSKGNAQERAICAELVGDGRSPGEEEEEEVDDTPVPAPQDGGRNTAGKLHAATQARALRMDFASCYLPDHDEDAHFGHAKAGFVGGFRKHGVDAGAFSRALMKHALAGAKRAGNKQGRRSKPVNPYHLLQSAYLKTARARTPGASTAVIVSLRGATLRWAYVGDSAFAVLRGGKMVHRSAPQQHYFNCPYQLSAAGAGGDSVARAAVGEMAVAEGDVVVVGTDGLFDNVFDDELERVVRKGTELGLSPQSMADKIAAVARKMSRSWWTPSPFSVESARDVKDGRERFLGGKVDDITVVVAYIVSKDS
ncbi:hypothetical protein EJB05_20656, partial [Eragrostis curvula]